MAADYAALIRSTRFSLSLHLCSLIKASPSSKIHAASVNLLPVIPCCADIWGDAMSSTEGRSTSSQGTHTADVLLHVEQEAPNKYKIESDQLEQIGLKLRGPRRFSIFSSIILPALVTLLTTILTGTFQYVSWINTVRLQDASNVADRATQTLDKAAGLIGQRRYATLVFIPTVRDLAQSEPSAPSPKAPGNSSSGSNTAVFVPASTEATAVSVVPAPPLTLPLAKVSFDLEKGRYNSYYDQLKQWNNGYDQLIADIGDNLDRPILADASIDESPVTIFQEQIKSTNCDNALLDELKKLHLNENSLKLQFAVINHCFQVLHNILDSQLTRVLNHSTNKIDPKVITGTKKSLNDILTSANVFRCVASLRVKYYNKKKEKSIVVPNFVRRLLFDPNKFAATNEFESEQTRCSPDKRPT